MNIALRNGSRSQCMAISKTTGVRCGLIVVPGSGLCMHHDPVFSKAVAAKRKKKAAEEKIRGEQERKEAKERDRELRARYPFDLQKDRADRAEREVERYRVMVIELEKQLGSYQDSLKKPDKRHLLERHYDESKLVAEYERWSKTACPTCGRIHVEDEF